MAAEEEAEAAGVGEVAEEAAGVVAAGGRRRWRRWRRWWGRRPGSDPELALHEVIVGVALVFALAGLEIDRPDLVPSALNGGLPLEAGHLELEVVDVGVVVDVHRVHPGRDRSVVDVDAVRVL